MVDCAVIGAGAFGSWTALKLRQAGSSVVLVDAFGAGNPKASSGGASRVIRLGYGADEIYTRWAMRSLEDWKALFSRAGRADLFQPTGVLWTARPGHPHAAGTVDTFRKLGVAHQQLSAADIRARYPEMRFEHEVIGIFEPHSGALLANHAVRAVADEAVRAGAEWIEARIVPPSETTPPEFLTTQDGRRIAAGNFIFACGPWLPKLFPRAVGRRIRVTRQPVFYFHAGAVNLPIWIDFSDPRGGYAIPPIACKGFKLALDRHGAEFDPDTGSRAPTAREESEAREFLGERFPALRESPVIASEVCQYESTATGDFLLDQHPSMPNVWLAGGGSGHGFKHGPAVGAYLAGLIGGAAGEVRFAWEGKAETPARTVY